jgi:protease-4
MPPQDESYRIAAAAGAGGFGLGLHHTQRSTGRSWSLASASSLELSDRLRAGFLVHIPIADASRSPSLDLGLAWRPSPWFGAGATSRGLSAADTLDASTTLGVALRPGVDWLTLGIDGRRNHQAVPGQSTDLLEAVLRVRPISGLYLRAGGAFGASDGESTWSVQRFGVGLEVYVSGSGAGYHVRASETSDPVHTTWFGTDDASGSVVPRRKHIEIVDLTQPPPSQRTTRLFVQDKRQTWSEALSDLEDLAGEERSRGVLLMFGDASMSWSRHQELQRRIRALREQGQVVVAYLEGAPDTATYTTAALADQVWIHPASTLDLTGIRATIANYRGALDLLGVSPQVVRRSEYKSGTETYSHHEPSSASLEQTNALLDDRMEDILRTIGEGRSQENATVNDWINGGPYTPAEALSQQLVDGIVYPDELTDGFDGGPLEDLPLVERAPPARPSTAWESPQQIALIHVEGVIMGGESGAPLLGPTTAGSQTIQRQLEAAAEDDNVAAIVLRVNSPGGSAYASDEIARTIHNVQRSGKPVIASFGSVAASGGYYVAAGADAIWAESATITGSIGVYTVKFGLDTLRDNVGISTTSLERGHHAGLYSDEAWDVSEAQRVDELIGYTYNRFKRIVAEGRDLSMEEVESHARGRVWSGRRALEVGLVDELGGVLKAIEDACSRAEVRDCEQVVLKTYRAGGSALPGLPFVALRESIMRQTDAQLRSASEPLRRVLGPAQLGLLYLEAPEQTVWALDERWLEEGMP